MNTQDRIAFASAGAVRKWPEMTLDMAMMVVRNPAQYTPWDVTCGAICVLGNRDMASPEDVMAATNLI